MGSLKNRMKKIERTVQPTHVFTFEEWLDIVRSDNTEAGQNSSKIKYPAIYLTWLKQIEASGCNKNKEVSA